MSENVNIKNKKLVVLAGTNASGKSSLGIELAKHYGGEIVSADSRQVFEGLDLGSGKVTFEEMQGITHHMIDVARVNDFFSLSKYQEMAYTAIDDILSRDNKAFLVGGTGLYINAVVDGYNISQKTFDPAIREKVKAMSREEQLIFLEQKSPESLTGLDIKNPVRVERAVERILSGAGEQKPNSPRYDCLVLGVTWPREKLYERIRERLDRRLKEGMLEEVIRLRENGATDDFLYKLGLEYRYILMYLKNEFAGYDEFYNKLFMEIRHLAKEQMTWFRKRRDIVWLDMENAPYERAIKLIDEFYDIQDCGSK